MPYLMPLGINATWICIYHIRIKQITLMFKTNRPSHSDTKKLDHFNEITYQLSIFQQKAERETIALLNNLKGAS